MALKGILTEEEYGNLGDPFKGEYVKGEDDQYYLDVEAVGDWAFENVAGLRNTAKTERQRREEWERKHNDLAKTLNGVSPEDVAKLNDMKEELERLRKLPDEEKTREKITALERKYENKLRESNEEKDSGFSARDERIKRLVVEGQASRILNELKCINPELHMGEVLRRCRATDDDEVEVLGADGEPAMTAKKGASGPMTLKEYLEGLKDRYPQNFRGTGAAGGGTDPGGAGGSGQHGNNPYGPGFDKLSPLERLKRIRRAQMGA